MWRRIKSFWPGPRLRGRFLLVSAVLTVGVLAFCWGRRGAVSEAGANPPGAPMVNDRPLASNSGSDYGNRVVAYIYNSIPITREDLGEYLIARFGAQRVEFLVNRRIVEMACQAKGITVTDQEVEYQLKKDLAGFGTPVPLTEKEFEANILRRFNKTLYEWKEDVVRPKLAMTKLCDKQVVVTEEDVQKEFDARYGAKVQCRWLVLAKNDPHKDEVWAKVSKSEEAFREHAMKQMFAPLASKAGEAPPIHRNFGDANIEKEAFSLKPGDVSRMIQMPPPDENWVILKCDKHLPPDSTKRLEDERLALHKEVWEIKLQQEIPKAFKMLRQQANPAIFLRDQVRQEDLEREVRKSLEVGQSAPAQDIRSSPPPVK